MSDRRTAVQEPSTHDGDCEADWGSEGQESPCRCTERAQGEPTDAQCVEIANRAQAVTGRSIWPSTVREILRAAYETRGEGR